MRKFLLLLVLVAALVLDVAGQASDATRSDASSNAEAAVKALEDRLAAGGSAPVKAVTRKTRAGVKKVAPCSELDAIEKILPVSSEPGDFFFSSESNRRRAFLSPEKRPPGPPRAVAVAT